MLTGKHSLHTLQSPEHEVHLCSSPFEHLVSHVLSGTGRPLLQEIQNVVEHFASRTEVGAMLGGLWKGVCV